MKYLLDTNICIYALKENPPSVIKHLKSLSARDIAVSTITIAELRHGASNSQHPIKNHKIIDVFSGSLTVEQFSNYAALHYGKIYTALRKRGTPIGQMDCLIAAHALALNLTLVTNNTKEFARIPHLATRKLGLIRANLDYLISPRVISSRTLSLADAFP